MDRCNKFEASSMSSHEFSLSDIKQSEKKATLKKKQILQQIVYGKLYVHMQKNDARSVSPCTQSNSEWIRELNVHH